MRNNKITYIILSEKSWNHDLLRSLSNKFSQFNWVFINKYSDFNIENLDYINPVKVFIPHWSHIIPDEIFQKYECIVFHMTDLPFGRGGSPLQNLIVRGYDVTKVSALKVVKELDAGPVYLKKDLSLLGNAEEIFIRTNDIIKDMIKDIVKKNLKPKKQVGDIVHFKRRKPNESNIADLKETKKMFDFIRMLDAEGYPKAFIENDYFKFEFSRASLKSNGEIIADVKILKKD